MCELIYYLSVYQFMLCVFAGNVTSVHEYLLVTLCDIQKHFPIMDPCRIEKLFSTHQDLLLLFLDIFFSFSFFGSFLIIYIP